MPVKDGEYFYYVKYVSANTQPIVENKKALVLYRYEMGYLEDKFHVKTHLDTPLNLKLRVMKKIAILTNEIYPPAKYK